MILQMPEQSREDGLCVRCKKELATEDWSPNGVLGYVHGDVWAWCKRCVLKAQIAHCRSAAERLPDLEAELTALDSTDERL